MFMVISLLQIKSLDVNGSAMRVSNCFPPRLEKRYIKIGFIPTIAKNSANFLKFITSISKYENAIAIKHHPPLTMMKELVHIRFIIGIKGSMEYPMITPISPVIIRISIFFLCYHSFCSNIPTTTPHIV